MTYLWHVRLTALCIALAVVGCGKSGPGRLNLTGKVNYDGQPLVYGLIYFNPDRSKGQSGPQGAGEIRAGQYKTNPDYGPVSGPHIVRITGWNSGPDQGMLGLPLFTDYEFPVEISPDKRTFDFDVPTVRKKS